MICSLLTFNADVSSIEVSGMEKLVSMLAPRPGKKGRALSAIANEQLHILTILA